APARGRVDEVAAIERRAEAGADQRRLSRTGRSRDRHAAVVAEPFEQFVGVRLAAEEEQRFLGLERSEARERGAAGRDTVEETTHPTSIQWRSGSRNGSRSETWNDEV